MSSRSSSPASLSKLNVQASEWKPPTPPAAPASSRGESTPQKPGRTRRGGGACAQPEEAAASAERCAEVAGQGGHTVVIIMPDADSYDQQTVWEQLLVIVEAAARDADWVMAGIVGSAGLEPTLEAARQGAVVALANKECLVCAGNLMLDEIARSGATLLPVDSEHNAIFQVFEFERRETIEKIILTASGGPFRTWSLEEMRDVTPAEAVAHPNWDMGAKISVDSATMMNKGLELIEAFYLFGLPEDRIDILVHPQSIVHSMVSYVDGSVLAQLGSPDMRTPISYTLAWPRRTEAPSPRLDLGKIAKLTFEAPDSQRFPALRLARVALKTGGSAPTILNASNEEAVAGFLAEKVGFPDIPRIVEETLEKMSGSEIRSVDDVLMVDAEARRVARDLMSTEGLQV